MIQFTLTEITNRSWGRSWTISDSGCGIPDDIQRRILDPFFSTKTTDKKRGSGLGLSVVDAVMKDHGGYLDLSSKVGYGTSFYLYFPLTRDVIGDVASDDLIRSYSDAIKKQARESLLK